MTFSSFDPLAAKSNLATEAAINAIKREIRNILDSYVGWYDPFSELIQNALDAIDERRKIESFQPKIRITIDIKNNSLSVADNGVGLNAEKFKQFLAPSFSFKSGPTRGHKGVGATYLAYGFNFIRICTKHPEFVACGKMVDARKWLSDENPAANPNIVPELDGDVPGFEEFDRGAGITVNFDKTTKPGDLRWIQVRQADRWLQILRVKTGLGAVHYDFDVLCEVRVIDTDGKITEASITKPAYYWPHLLQQKQANLVDLAAKERELFLKKGASFSMPSNFRNVEVFYQFIEAGDLEKYLKLEDAEKQIYASYKVWIYFCYFYTAKVFTKYNEDIGVRKGQSIIAAGIQMAANNMPQGELIQIPLRRNIGRQNQMHIVFHFEDVRPDLGRKGFQKEFVEFAESVSSSLIQSYISKYTKYLKPTTGADANLVQQQKVDDWKKEFEEHEKQHPLVINNPLFFRPKTSVSILSVPTREQDVIALFNQFLAGGVVRGVDILSTNERFAYDSMFRVVSGPEAERASYVYDASTNPLGIHEDNFIANFRSSPKILEYKFSLDALIEDIETGVKNTNEIDMVVVWETGEDYRAHFTVRSLIDPENLAERAYHGLSHRMSNISSGQHEMNLVVLSEIVDYLNEQEQTVEKQKQKYEE